MTATTEFVELDERERKERERKERERIDEILRRLAAVEKFLQTADTPKGPIRYLFVPDLAKRYRRSAMTIKRWRDNPSVGFPAPDLFVQRRPAWTEATAETWERGRADRVPAK